MSPRRTTTPSSSLTTSCRNSSGVLRSVLAIEVYRHHRALGSAERRQVVVARQRLAHRRRRNAVRGHAIGLQPDTHRERAIAENVGALNAADGAELRLDDARQIVGNLVRIELGRREPHVDRRELVVGRFELDDGRLGLGRQVVANLRHLRLNLRERRVRVVVQLQVHGNRAERLRAGRVHVVDAVGARDDALERRRDEPAHQVGVRADIDRRHPDDRDVAARILANTERANRLQPGDEDDEADDDRENRALDEQISETHRAVGSSDGRSVRASVSPPASATDCWPAAPCC